MISDVERRARRQRGEQPGKPGPVHELGAGDPVVLVDVGRVDGPALAERRRRSRARPGG